MNKAELSTKFFVFRFGSTIVEVGQEGVEMGILRFDSKVLIRFNMIPCKCEGNRSIAHENFVMISKTRPTIK